MFGREFGMMELTIETLTGASVELLVSPYETVYDIKAKIQKLEGIPITQQHLIWQTTELNNDYSLQYYNIHSGATLKLVLNMRGGPVNTRRVPHEEPSLHEMAEYFTEANGEEYLPGNRPVTVIVYQNGEHLNFYRLVDRDAASSLSYSMSGAGSDYNPDENSPTPKERREENDKTRDKMKTLKMQMQNMTLNKDKKTKKSSRYPRPPSSIRPMSRSRLLHHVTASKQVPVTGLNKNVCLPPVGHSSHQQKIPSILKATNVSNIGEQKPLNISHPFSQPIPRGSLNASQLNSTDIHSFSSASTSTPKAEIKWLPPSKTTTSGLSTSDSNSQSSVVNKKIETKQPAVADHGDGLSISQDKVETKLTDYSLVEAGFSHHKGCEITSPTETQNVIKKRTGDRELKTSLPNNLKNVVNQTSNTTDTSLASNPSSSPISDAQRLSSSAGQDDGQSSSYSVSPTKRTGGERKVALQSLNHREVRAMSGMLRDIMRSANRSRNGYILTGPMLGQFPPSPTYGEQESIVPPKVVRVLSGSREGRITPIFRLPSVNAAKKRSVKRCIFCGKKTRLGTGFLCRCGENFCSVHRYPEVHSCSFDYKAEGRKLIEQSNPVVSAPKLPKI